MVVQRVEWNVKVPLIAAEGRSKIGSCAQEVLAKPLALLWVKPCHHIGLYLVPKGMDASGCSFAFLGQLNPNRASVLSIRLAFYKAQGCQPCHGLGGSRHT